MLVNRALFPYQEQTVEWLRSLNMPGYVAHEPGLGKTITAINYADRINARRVLVVSPAHGRRNWAREFNIWQQLPRTVRAVAKSQEAIPPDDRLALIVSYDMLSTTQSPIRERLLFARWDLLVLDEAHFLGRNSERTRFILGVTNGLYKRAGAVLPLSGSPATKSASELYPVLRALWPPLVENKSWRDWEDTYCRVKTLRVGFREVRTVTGTKPEKLPELRAKLAPIMSVLRTDDVKKDIPPLRVQTYPILTGEGERAAGKLREFHKVESELSKLLNDITVANVDGDAVSALQHAEVAFATQRRFIGTLKAPHVAQLVREELEAFPDMKIVLFAIHRDVLDILAATLDSFGVVRVDGATKDKVAAQDQFQTDPNTRVFLGQIKAAGTNLTLTASHNVGIVEASWNPGDNYQAIRRCRRIGQTKPVLARFFTMDGADDRISRVLAERSLELEELFKSEDKGAA